MITVFNGGLYVKIRNEKDENVKFFEKRNIPFLDIKNKDIRNLNPDLVFYTQAKYLYSYLNPYNVSEYALTFLAPYNYDILDSCEKDFDFIKENYSNLYTFFAQSPYHRKI